MASLREQRVDGERAKALLDDPLLQGAFDRLEEDYKRNWANTSFDDEQKREHYFRLMKALEGLKKDLQRVMMDGQLAAAEIERDE